MRISTPFDKSSAYLTRRVNEILPLPRTKRQDALRQDLEQAHRDLDNIKAAIRQGLITATTKAMLEETEARVARAEAALRGATQTPRTADALPRLVEHHLRDLRCLMGKDPSRARMILQKLIGEVKLELNEQGLVAILWGNIWGILNLEETYCTTGAGSPSPSLAHVVDDIAVA